MCKQFHNQQRKISTHNIFSLTSEAKQKVLEMDEISLLSGAEGVDKLYEILDKMYDDTNSEEKVVTAKTTKRKRNKKNKQITNENDLIDSETKIDESEQKFQEETNINKKHLEINENHSSLLPSNSELQKWINKYSDVSEKLRDLQIQHDTQTEKFEQIFKENLCLLEEIRFYKKRNTEIVNFVKNVCVWSTMRKT